MDATALPRGVLVLLDGIPAVDEAQRRTRQDLPDVLCRQILRWIGEQDSNNLSKIYMPLDNMGASYGYGVTSRHIVCLDLI